MDDDASEIISRPPSNPIASTLLIVSVLGTILAIGFVWAELFGEYLPTPPPGQAAGKHDSRQIAEQHRHDHYATDFGAGGDVMSGIEKDLGVSGPVGDVGAGDGG